MIVLVPGVLALLPEYAGLTDPVPELRAACREAVAALAATGPVEVAGTDRGVRVGRHLLAEAGGTEGPGGGLLVVANGSAMRTEKAPGHLDERAEAFDAALGRALAEGDAEALASLDQALAVELWADTVEVPRLAGLGPAEVLHDAAPYGVQYWVMRWS